MPKDGSQPFPGQPAGAEEQVNDAGNTGNAGNSESGIAGDCYLQSGGGFCVGEDELPAVEALDHEDVDPGGAGEPFQAGPSAHEGPELPKGQPLGGFGFTPMASLKRKRR